MDKNVVEKALQTAYYVSDFVTEAEESLLLRNIYNAPITAWVNLSKRRLQNIGGVPHAKGMISESIPACYHLYFNKLTELGVFDVSHKPNHVLVNEYLPGQGITPHEDGPYYFPIVATISLGCHTFLDFYRPINSSAEIDENISYDNRYMFSLLLEPRSLVVLTKDMYTSCLHGIAERNVDMLKSLQIVNMDLVSDSTKRLVAEASNSSLSRESARVSLTFRHVSNVSKLNINKLFGK